MSKAAPIVLSFVVVFSVLGYIAMDSSSNESKEDYFICDNGEKISSDLQKNGFEDFSVKGTLSLNGFLVTGFSFFFFVLGNIFFTNQFVFLFSVNDLICSCK